jgi:hypothetical protein
MLLYQQGDLATSKDLFQRALGIYEQTLGPNHRRTAGIAFTALR